MNRIERYHVGNDDRFTQSLEEHTAALPSSTYLGVAFGAMAISLVCQMTGRGKWGNFIAQWVPTLLTIGIYNKLVKLTVDDREVEQLGDYVCEFCDSKFSLEDDLRNHELHCPSHRTADIKHESY
jgi:hypothetical protein